MPGSPTSRRLSERSIDHVVLERGEVANSWRTERWDSLRLLTPNWQTTLPGRTYHGIDPDGFMTMPEVADFIGNYAAAIDAPTQTGTTVTRVAATEGGYRVVTDRGDWECRTVVLASGASNVADVPAVAAAIPPAIATVTPLTYRSPDDLDDGGVLVVGGSATGVQLADEIQRSGRQVTLAVGEHVRMPRTYRGRDIFWWMEAAGVLDERFDQVDDLVRARHLPSPQLIGTPDRRSLDLNSLAELGIEIVGRVGAIRDGVAQFSGGLAERVPTRRFEAEPSARSFRRVGAARRRRSARALASTRTDNGRGRRRTRDRSTAAQHRNDLVGHRISTRLFVARRAGARSQRTDPSPWRRRHRCTWHVRARWESAAHPTLQLHRRRRRTTQVLADHLHDFLAASNRSRGWAGITG